MTIFESAMEYMEGDIATEGKLPYYTTLKGTKNTWKAAVKATKQGGRFTAKNAGLIAQNMLTDKSSSFEGIHGNLLKMVKRCKTKKELDYLRKDVSRGKQQLKREAANADPSRKKAIEEHIKWLDTEFRDAINEKAKEIKNNE